MKTMIVLRSIAWIENIILLFIISFTFYISLPIQTEKTLFVPHGSIENIISQLTKKGYNLSKIDNYILRVMGTPKSGWHSMGKNELNRIDFLYKLTSSKAMIHKITLIPGETLELFFDELSKNLKLDKDELQKQYLIYSHYPEAGIYADTYHVPYGIKEKNLMKFLTKVSQNRYKSISKNYYEEFNQTQWSKILVIASIIQKEAANNKEMPLVSSVIYNRLKKNMRLQMDGTLNYGKYSHIRVTPERIRTDKSSFNTYKHRGLPSSPIGSVSSTAIKAAIKPSKTDYLYFMRNTKGVHDFSKTYKNHRKNIRNVK